MKYNLTLLICALLLTSCAQIRKNNAKKLDTENRTDVKSKYNDDNIIFVDGKEYLYKVVQKDKDRIINFDLTVKMIPGNYSFGTKIKYKHYYKDEFLTEQERNLYLDTVKHYKWDITSAQESTEEFIMFPPRSYTLKKLEIAPYPELEFPLIKGSKFGTYRNIVAGYGEYNMNRIYAEHAIEDVMYTTDSSYIAKIKATSNWEKEVTTEKICTVDFEFDSKLGFTKMHYYYADGTSVLFTMEK